MRQHSNAILDPVDQTGRPDVREASGTGASLAKTPYWSFEITKVLAELGSAPTGLTSAQAEGRLKHFGANLLEKKGGSQAIRLLARQFRSPLVLILIFAAGISIFVGEVNEAIIIGAIVLLSCLLGFWQEFGASRAMEALKKRIAHKSSVLRDGRVAEVNASEIVPGDVVSLAAGNLIAADGVILQSRDFNVSEAVMTGETFPVVKSPGVSSPDAPLAKRSNVVYAGTSVRSGTATVLAVSTGADTEFAKIAETVAHSRPETEFARGIRHFGYLMTEIMLAIVIVIFLANLLLHRPVIESLLFSLALAVGLTPELLPAIISVTLSRGARTMAKDGVIVRRLEAIENLGSMNVLCTDKTGTLTEGVVELSGWVDAAGNQSRRLLAWAKLNSSLQTGLANPLDTAVAGCPEPVDLSAYRKIDEIPYDFIRKRLTVVVGRTEKPDMLICKGAVSNVLAACTTVLAGDEAEPLDASALAAIDTRFRQWSQSGLRVLAVAIRETTPKPRYVPEDEADLALAGFLLFLDPPKKGIAEALAALRAHGVGVKMITGDNRHIAAHLAATIGLKAQKILTGQQLAHMTKEALVRRATRTDLFVEIDPNQKERIIEAFRRHGHVVGYLGDGINDAPALHAADVGISVDGAVDVAREAADMILLKQDLGVLLRGIDDGRKTFANTMKYISITTSANFGNMISMALASLFLPFLPLLPKQILLNNLLADLPSLAIATDNVDIEQMRTPRRWNIRFVRRFMVVFGLASSIFDIITFAFLLVWAHAHAPTFQTGWFVESLVTQLTVVLVVRTRHAFWASRPATVLLWLTLTVGILAAVLPYLFVAPLFGFVPLPASIVAGLAAISLAYLALAEAIKRRFYRT